ncbi:MAG TPA: hypothetical protein DCL61_29380, partial [Cyanobacteria bacterium UBA12227]|nr:hypothetical protein [Cyanobacteria bacterium UBA12227]
ESARGGGQSLSENIRQPMEQAMGADFSGVKVHTDGQSHQLNQSIQARAFTTGQDIFFRQGEYDPGSRGGQELLAHELTHVVQQNGNAVQRQRIVGNSPNHYPRQPLTAYIAPLLQRQENFVQLRRASNDLNKKFKKALSSETGLSVLMDSQILYADQGLITTANAALTKVGKHGSFIQLDDTKGQITHEGHALKKVTPVWVNKGSNSGYHAGVNSPNAGGADSEGLTSGSMALWSDCGRSSAAVTGSVGGDRKAVYNKGGAEQTTSGLDESGMHPQTDNAPGHMANQIYYDLMYDFMTDSKNAAYLKSAHKEQVFDFWKSVTSFSYKTKDQIKKPSNGLEAQQLYDQLTNAGKNAFDKAAGINHYANPAIGEAYTMSSGYNFPSFKEYPGEDTWNFHWAGVIMKDGSDNITLENFAVTDWYAKSKGVDQGDFINREWNFDMYGSVKSDGTVDKDETFHKDHLDTHTHGTKATSMAVRTDQ